MKDFEYIQKAVDKAFEDFLVKTLRLEGDKLLYFYWTIGFFETIGGLSFRYFHLTTRQKEELNEIAKNYFDDPDIRLEINRYSNRHDLNIRNVNKLFTEANKAGQQNRNEYLKEFVFWKVLEEKQKQEEAGRKESETMQEITGEPGITRQMVDQQRRNFLLTYLRYLVENYDKPTIDILKVYKKYTLTSRGEELKKKIELQEEFDERKNKLLYKRGRNDKLLYKIDKLYILTEFETRLHFVFSRPGGDEKEELRELLDIMGRDETGKLYRGQARSDWQLDSSLTRDDNYRKYEAEMYYDILSLKPDAFENDHSIYERLITMQHFGMPTRLLDITRNPLVAIFFACNNLQEAGKDGMVYTFRPSNEDFLNFEDKKLKCLECLYNKNIEDREEAEQFLSGICFIKGIAKNQRINNQSGDFIFVGTGENTRQQLRDLPALTIVIDAPTKKVLLEQLESLNIHGGAVYPDLTHMSTYIRHKYLGRKDNPAKEQLNQVDLNLFHSKKNGKKEKSATSKTEEVNPLLYAFPKYEKDSFWNDQRNKMMTDFARKNKLKNFESWFLIDRMLAFNKEPLRDDLIEIMLEKPSLTQRKAAATEVLEKIYGFINQLKETTL